MVAYRRRDWSREHFRRYFQEVHGALALAIPGLRRYVQNFTMPDERCRPPRDALIEFWFDDALSMEAVWQSAEGHRATQDNANCMDIGEPR